MFAGYPVDPRPALAQEVDTHIDEIRERSVGMPVTILSRSSISLGGIRAQRVVVGFFDGQMKRWLVEDFVEALRGGVEYYLYLLTQSKSYEGDKVIFDSVLGSFRLVKARLK